MTTHSNSVRPQSMCLSSATAIATPSALSSTAKRLVAPLRWKVTSPRDITSAEFRRRASILDNVHFETIQQRREFMTTWKKTEPVLILDGATVKNYERRYVIYRVPSITFNLWYCLMSNYHCVESAYTRAENIVGWQVAM